jgi:hypothetical protein
MIRGRLFVETALPPIYRVFPDIAPGWLSVFLDGDWYFCQSLCGLSAFYTPQNKARWAYSAAEYSLTTLKLGRLLTKTTNLDNEQRHFGS